MKFIVAPSHLSQTFDTLPLCDQRKFFRKFCGDTAIPDIAITVYLHFLKYEKFVIIHTSANRIGILKNRIITEVVNINS